MILSLLLNNTFIKEKDETMRNLLIVLLIGAIVVAGASFGILIAGIGSVTTTDTTKIRPDYSTQFFDINGELIGTSESIETRIPINIKNVPKSLEQAFLAAEDIRFYDHYGVDFRGIGRAVWANITNQGISEGGSTITQQLAKNLFLSQDRNFRRKIQEVILAIKLEKQYSKKEILEMYLNQIYFGQGSYGIESAALTYFGKHTEKLNLAESAMLAGLPKSPNYYSPLKNPQAAKERQELVLSQMLKYSFITQQEYEQAKAYKLKYNTSDLTSSSSKASYFLDYVSQLIAKKYGEDVLYKQGLKVYTTLDIKQQIAAEESIKYLPTNYKTQSGAEQPQLALVAVEPGTGYIKAMLGGRGGKDQYNRAVLAMRQPGSAFKPFLYLAAVEAGMNAATVIEDKAVHFADGWAPSNYSRNFSNWVSMRTAIKYSLNIPAVLVGKKVGYDKIIYYARQLGISTLVTEGYPNDVNPASLTLGGLTKGVIPLEMANAMATLGAGGMYNEPIAIIKIVDREGKTIFEHKPKPQRVVSAKSAYTLTDLLQSVISSGTGTGAGIGRPAAGKTGTTDTCKDAWFVGYTPNLAAAVWIGNDDGEINGGMTGGDLPATIWGAFMRKALANVPVKYFENPGVGIPGEPKLPGKDGFVGDALRIPDAPEFEKPSTANIKNPNNKTNDKTNNINPPSPPPIPPTPPKPSAPPIPQERPSAPILKQAS